MKSTKSTFVAVCAILFSVLACENVKTPTPPTNNPGNDQGSLQHIIPVAQAVRMHANYNTKLKPVIEETQNELLNRYNYKGTQYVWIDINNLKDYISFLESVENKNPNQPKISGVGIFLAAHDDNYNATKIDKRSKKRNARRGDYRGRETVFLNPTYLETNASNNNFLLNHKPFQIISTDTSDAYIGNYSIIDGLDAQQNTTLDALRGTMLFNQTKQKSSSLAYDELGTVPPM